LGFKKHRKIRLNMELENLEFQKKILLASILDTNVNNIFTKNYKITEVQNLEYHHKLKLLESGYPLDYLLKKIKFLDLEILVTPKTLIPRHETEEWVAELIKKLKVLNLSQTIYQGLIELSLVVDIGCGSGIIGLSLAKYFENAILTDVSKEAIVTAIENAKVNEIKNAIFLESDLLDSNDLRSSIEKYDSWILVSNLPYLPASDDSFISKSNVRFEPQKALYSGENGLDLFKKLLIQINELKIKPSVVYFELDPRNIREAESLLCRIYSKIEVIIDQNNLERVLIGTI